MSELDEVRRIAEQALALGERNSLEHEGHEDVCAERYKASESAFSELRTDVRDLKNDFVRLGAELKDGIKLVGESLRQQNEALSSRMNGMMSDMNGRQSNLAATVTDSANQTVHNLKELMDKGLDIARDGVTAANASLTAFIHAQTETNRDTNSKFSGAHTRIDGVASSLTQLRTDVGKTEETLDSKIAVVDGKIWTLTISVGAFLIISLGAGLLTMLTHYVLKMW